MEVNFDGLRKHLINDYNSLVRKLNKELKDNEYLYIHPFDIQRDLDGIRSCLVTLAFTYLDGEEGFNSLGDDVYFERFNEEE